MRIAHGLRRTGALVAAFIMVLSGAPAHAATLNVLCTGFTGCLSLSLSDSGYGRVYLSSFWSMTAGHNCTNYLAYRLTHGRLVARPPETRNAASWGPAAQAVGVPVVDTPQVGDVAWWAADYHGASSSGHVAYVESVLLDTVTVSEDNLNGDFRWRSITRSSGGWPSGFIRYSESDGSPSGVFTSVTSPSPGQLDFWATSSDPDAGSGDRSYLATLGGPRGAAGVESFTFATPFFRFHRIKGVTTRGTVPMYLYALNEPGTAGKDTLLGVRTVQVRSSSAVDASLSKPSISRRAHPRVRVSLAPTLATGTVDVVQGSKVLKRVTAGGSRQTVTLPRQRKGTWTLKVRYHGSDTYLGSSKKLLLRVR